MEIIDSKGRLFGRVNIIDALVVLLVLAVVAAGAALVMGSGEEPDPQPSSAPDYATLTISPVSEDLTSTLLAAENLSLVDNGGRLRITDTFVTPHPTQDAALAVVRAERVGGNSPLPTARPLTVAAGQSTFNATVRGFTDASTLSTSRKNVTLRTTVSDEVSAAVQAGESYRIGTESVATLSSVTTAFSDGKRQVTLGLAVETIQSNGVPRFADRPVRLGAELPFRTDEYALSGTVVGLGGQQIERRNVTATLETTVDRAVAQAVDEGDEYSISGRPVARIDSVRSIPTVNSTDRRLQLDVVLQTVVRGDSTEYLGIDTTLGARVPFRADEYALDATIVELNGSATERVDATLDVRWENVRPDVADSLAVGMTEQHRGADAQITALDTEPATVVVTSDSGEVFAREHPVEEDVSLSVAIEARQNGDSLLFHGRPVQNGDTVVLDFGTVTVEGTVTGIAADG